MFTILVAILACIVIGIGLGLSPWGQGIMSFADHVNYGVVWLFIGGTSLGQSLPSFWMALEHRRRLKGAFYGGVLGAACGCIVGPLLYFIFR